MLARSAAIYRHEWRMLMSEIIGMSQMIIMPLVMMAFLIPMNRGALQAQGFEGANGSEQVVPGMIVMFSMFMTGQVAFLFFRDHGYGTWERLRASPARPFEIVLGKAANPMTVVVAQQALLFAFGAVLFGFRVNGSVVAFVPVMFAYGLALACIGVALAAVCRSNQQVNLISSVVAMAFSGLGGAFVPLDALPGWAQAVAPATPTYWAMKAYRGIALEHAGVLDVLGPAAMLLVIAAVGGAVAATRFRVEETKVLVG